MTNERKAAVASIQIDNENVRVTKYYFAPGAETKFHKHIWDYVIIPITDGELLLIGLKGEENITKISKGISYYRRAGVEHNVINLGKKELIFIEIEMKED